MANPTSLKQGDLWLWLATNEEQLLLHTGLMRLADHIPVPSGVAEVTDRDSGLPDMDGKKPSDLAEIILRECGTKTTTYGSLIEYRRTALCGYWNAVRVYEKEQKTASSATKDITAASTSSIRRSTNGGGSSEGGTGTTSSAGFASRVSLVLILPIMKSLSRFDPGLSSEAASGLLECLRVYEPLSLSGEQLDSVQGLESLLHSWLAGRTGEDEEKEEREEEDRVRRMKQVQNAASALVALSVAV